MANMKITLKKSLAGRLEKHIATAHSLGLKKINDVTVQPDNAQTRGKVKQIGYLLEIVEEAKPMKLHELTPAAGATKPAYRKGRGAGSGNGKTAGRGHKGQWARSGGGVRPGFEGGQMPLARRIPKRGFNNIFAKPLTAVNVAVLNQFEDGAVVDSAALIAKGILQDCKYGLKVLGNGNVTKKVTVKAAAFSESAKEKIEKAGGKAEVV